MKKLYVLSVVVTLVAVLSLSMSGVASAKVNWNKWQPITHDVVSGTFKFAGNTWKVKEYQIPGFVGDLVGYLDMPFEEYYYEALPECQAQGGKTGGSISQVWIGELTGRDMSYVEQERVYMCIYPAGWHDAQE
ncbi:MAG: hypothetical protein PVI80_09395 [Anaerolineae bacterium]|jgi:hypothetical protein